MIQNQGAGMFNLTRSFILALAFALLPTLAAARDEQRVERVSFKDGRATIRGRIKGYDHVDYVFPAGAGESIQINLRTNKLSNYFNLMAPGSDVAMPNAMSVIEYSGAAPTSGDYRARVYLYRNDARRGVTANYTLTIALGEQSRTNEKGPDYADGLTGGPDYWEVTGVGHGDELSMRKAPSPKGALVMRFANGAVLKNLGCKNTGGQRWCRVERPDDPSMRGWVNGRYLRESAGPQ